MISYKKLMERHVYEGKHSKMCRVYSTEWFALICKYHRPAMGKPQFLDTDLWKFSRLLKNHGTVQ